MIVNMKPLFPGDSVAVCLATVSENLSKLEGELFFHRDTIQASYIAFLENATQIKDNDAREAYMQLVKVWKCGQDRILESKIGINKIADQVDRLKRQLEEQTRNTTK